MLDRTTDWGNLKINTYAPPNVSLRLLNCGRRLSDVPGGFKVSTTGGLEAELQTKETNFPDKIDTSPSREGLSR